MSDEDQYYLYGAGHTGPYGTNEGDCWLSPGSPIQDRLDQDGDGLVLVHEMIVKEGKLEECLYTTDNPELIKRAQEGHERYMARLASEN